MPRKRGGICACFGGDDTPEIQINMDKLHQVIAEEPMPPIDELDAKFEELVVCIIAFIYFWHQVLHHPPPINMTCQELWVRSVALKEKEDDITKYQAMRF